MILPGAGFVLLVAYALGVIAFPKLSLPWVVRFGLGAALESLVVFLLLVAGWAHTPVFLGIGFVSLAGAGFLWHRKLLQAGPSIGLPRDLALAVFGAYGLLYLVHALAPEIQPDAISYHLGLVAEYVRLGHFPDRVAFFELLPQGMEMLFTVAFALGQHSAAKLTHFAFLLATPPLMLQIARQLGIDERKALGGAALYFCAPVVGITGTCAYTDAAFVFFVLLTFSLLLSWQADRRVGYLVAAGLAAGFCYAIKFPGLVAAPLALAFVLIHGRRPRDGAALLAGVLVTAAPWGLRNLVLTGNPAAPLLNALFPNPFFSAAIEGKLAEGLKTYGVFHWGSAPWEYAFRGRLQGVVGPLLLLTPLALLSLRKRVGRLLLTAALLVLIPWWWNVGTRFLMPALPFLALALAVALPRKLLWVCIAVQAVVCWPGVIDRLQEDEQWRMGELPWRAALRLEAEPVYLDRMTGDYTIARMVENNTKPGDRIFCLSGLAKAYVTRESLEYWHSNQGVELMGSLYLAQRNPRQSSMRMDWPRLQARGLRFTATADSTQEWSVSEIQLFSPGDRIYASPRWTVSANPNLWQAPLALDRNRSTFWHSGDPVRRGMSLEVEFDRPQELTGAEMFSGYPGAPATVRVESLGADKAWHPLAAEMHDTVGSPMDLRHQATRALKSAGFRYILCEAGSTGLAALGEVLRKEAPDWGVRHAGEQTPVHLFEIY